MALGNSPVRDMFNCGTKLNLRTVVPTDEVVVAVFGDPDWNDSAPRYYYYDVNSSATDDGENVLKPTAVMGNGRFIKIPNSQTQPNWNQATSSAIDFIKNKPTLATVATSGDYNDLSNKPSIPSVLPPGSVHQYAGASAPTGYLLCDGSAVSRAAYSALFAAISTAYGVGDGSTTFNLPDTRQRFPLGKAAAGTGAVLGETGGSIDHVHTVDPPNTTTGAPSGTSGQLVGVINVASAGHTHDVNIAQFNSGANNPPYLVFNFIIKT